MYHIMIYFALCKISPRWRRRAHATKNMNDFVAWLRGFIPAPINAGTREKLAGCLGAWVGLTFTGMVSKASLGDLNPWFVAPMGASAVLLFAVPSSPLAQPWSIIGGNLVSALVGVACASNIDDPMLAASAAAAIAIAGMFALRCLHPPSGAVALTAVLGGPAVHQLGYRFALVPVAVNSAFLLFAALLFNNLLRRRYPHVHISHANPHHTTDRLPSERLGFTPEDLDDVLKQYNEVLDVSRDDLETLFLQAEMHAYRRRFGEITCEDVMSRDVVTVEYGTTLQDAWYMLRRHKVKALPVLDISRRVIGIVTFVDFMKNANLDVYEGFDLKLREFIRRTKGTHSNKAEVVGQIMTHHVWTVTADTHIVELVPLLSDRGLHHIPVVDNEYRLVGMITHSDLIGALYRGRLADTSQAA
jgi:CBS domain-containing membrane protein